MALIDHLGFTTDGRGDLFGQLVAQGFLLVGRRELSAGLEQSAHGAGARPSPYALLADPAGQPAGEDGHRQEHGQGEELLRRIEAEGEAGLDDVEVVEEKGQNAGEEGRARPESHRRHQDRGQEHRREPGEAQQSIEELRDNHGHGD